MKKTVVFLLVLALAICMVPFAATADPVSYAGGDGSEGSPYQIATAEQLRYFSEQINAGVDTDKFYCLTADIDLGGTYGTSVAGGITYYIATNNSTWTPAGTAAHPFQGCFNGGNHAISNLVTAGVSDYVGLFGYIQSATVKNVTIASGLITSVGKNAESIGTATAVGAIVGYLPASEGNVVDHCYNHATVFMQSTAASSGGGIVGDVGSRAVTLEITNCGNTGNVIAHTGSNNARIGGILGYAAGTACTITIENCVNIGNITVLASKDNNGTRAGGIAGAWNGKKLTMQNCLSTGTVTTPGGNRQGGTLIGNAKAAAENTVTYAKLYAADTVNAAAGNGTDLSGALIAEFDADCFDLLKTVLSHKDFSMKTGAAIRLVENSHGIRFVSDVSANAVAALNGINAENVQFGTIVLPTAALTGDLTLEALAAAGKTKDEDYIVIEASRGIQTDGDGNKTIYAAMVEESGKTYDAAMAFSAACYLQFTVNETVYRVYSAYDDENHSRSMKQVATLALADTSVVFSAEQIAILQSYAQ